MEHSIITIQGCWAYWKKGKLGRGKMGKGELGNGERYGKTPKFNLQFQL
jgi:hypothetical protein